MQSLTYLCIDHICRLIARIAIIAARIATAPSGKRISAGGNFFQNCLAFRKLRVKTQPHFSEGFELRALLWGGQR
jgi:hypothetical protein